MKARGLAGLLAVIGTLVAVWALLHQAPAWQAACEPGDVVCRYLTGVAPAVILNLEMALGSIGVGVVIGFALGWARVSGFASLRAVSRGYTELVRGTPLLIQIFLVFFAFPALNAYFLAADIPLRLQVPAVIRVVIALTVNTSAYQAEIFRAGFQSIAGGQLDAAASLGMTQGQAMLHVIIPQALRAVAPPLTNEYIIMFKDATPLAFIVAGTAVPELVALTRNFNDLTQAHLTGWFLTAGVFLGLALLLMTFLRLVERQFAVPGLGISVRAGE